jgi:integrase
MNSFTENLTNKLKDKNLTPSTINLYIRNLEKLNDKEPIKNFNFLKKVDVIKNKLDEYKNNTQRSYYISIVSALKTDDKYKSLYNKYYKIMIAKKKEIDEIPTTTMNDNQKENWISWDEVITIYNNLLNKVADLPKKIKTEKQYNILLDLVILSLYTNIEPRRNKDFQMMNIIKGYTMDDPKINYYNVDDNELVFNVYKSMKKHGHQKIEIPDNLKEVINIYIKNHPLIDKQKKFNVPFLVHYNGEPLNKINSITNILNRIFNKKLGSSMLRHIYLTYRFGDTYKEMQQVADNMGHTISTQKDYIKDV